MDFLASLGLFAAKTVLIVLAVGLVVGIISRAFRRGAHGRGSVKLTNLNERWRDTALAMNGELLPAREARLAFKAARARAKADAKREDKRPRVFVLAYDGNARASQTSALREELTAIFDVSRPGDEVVVRLHSPGGFVHAYGFAASQLERVKARGLRLTVVVDQIAASGGYMMAVVADEIIAAPFAIIGSIGVVAALPNFHRFLRKHDVDFEQHTAGKYKRTLTMFGENTDAGRQHFKEELELTHGLFKAFVSRYRPKLDLEQVATGQHWYGSQAVELGLVDRLQTSDDYLLERRGAAEVWSVEYVARRRPLDRAVSIMAGSVVRGTEAAVAGGITRAAEALHVPIHR